MSRPYLFTFWTSEGPLPAHIAMCRKTVFHNLGEAFEIIDLDFENCLQWVPERDLLWEFSRPAAAGRSHSLEGRRIALFSGMLRVALIARHGGLWVDADQIVFPNFRHFAPLVVTHDLLGVENFDGRLTNSVIGARHGSEFAAQLWSTLQDLLSEKEAEGNPTARWGEYGFNLLNRALHQHPPDGLYVAPFGSVISFNTEMPPQVFEPNRGRLMAISPLAAGFSIFNNAIGDATRALSPEFLADNGSLFALAYAIAMGKSKEAEDWLMIRSAEHLAALDRSASCLARVMEREEARIDRQDLKDRLSKRTGELHDLKERFRLERDQLKTKLAERTETLKELRANFRTCKNS